MKSLVLSITAAVLVALTLPAWAVQPLVTPEALSELAGDNSVQVVDIRPADAYAEGHIPDAVSAPYSLWRGPADNPGKLPSKAELQELVQSLGLDADKHAVVVSAGTDATDFGSSARVYWTLKYVGLTKLSILDGGYQAWQQQDLAVSNDAVTVAASDYQVQFNQDLIATTDDVAKQVDNPNTRLIDARPRDFYEGKTKAPAAAIPGTIKGAMNLEQSRWFSDSTNSSQLVSPAQAKAIADSSLTGSADENIAFCNTGHWAATDWFALSEVAGVKNVKLYPQSMVAWSQDDSLPMDNAPSRGQQIWSKVKEIFQ